MRYSTDIDELMARGRSIGLRGRPQSESHRAVLIAGDPVRCRLIVDGDMAVCGAEFPDLLVAIAYPADLAAELALGTWPRTVAPSTNPPR